MLIYCAEADKLYIELDDKDQKSIDDALNALLEDLAKSHPNLSETKRLKAVYGMGTSTGDIRDAIELSTLASKAAQKISKSIEDSIDASRIEEEYLENRLDYDLVDVCTYSFDIHFKDVIAKEFGENKKFDDLSASDRDKAINLYKRKIQESSAKAQALANVSTTQDFISLVITYSANEHYDTLFADVISVTTIYDRPIDTALQEIKTKMISDVIYEVKNNKAFADAASKNNLGEYVAYGIVVSQKFAEAANALKQNLYKEVSNDKNACVQRRLSYVKPNEIGERDSFSEWAFNAERKVGDTFVTESGDGANGAELNTYSITNEFTAKAYIMDNTAYKDDSLSHDIAYMMFEEEEQADATIALLEAIGSITKENFLEIAKNEKSNVLDSDVIEDYIMGFHNSDKAIDSFLADAKEGDFTTAPIVTDNNIYIIVYYIAKGDVTVWQYSARASVYVKEYTAYEEKMNKNFASDLVFNEKIINKVPA